MFMWELDVSFLCNGDIHAGISEGDTPYN